MDYEEKFKKLIKDTRQMIDKGQVHMTELDLYVSIIDAFNYMSPFGYYFGLHNRRFKWIKKRSNK